MKINKPGEEPALLPVSKSLFNFLIFTAKLT